MFVIDDNEFEKILADAIDDLPAKKIENMSNVAIVYADEPSEEQIKKFDLYHGKTLYGLYEGIPLVKRTNNYNLVLPDKITIFKKPIEYGSNSLKDLKENVKHTLWHELAHHFGLDHQQIDNLE